MGSSVNWEIGSSPYLSRFSEFDCIIKKEDRKDDRGNLYRQIEKDEDATPTQRKTK